MRPTATILPRHSQAPYRSPVLLGWCLALCFLFQADLRAASLKLGDEVLNLTLGDNARIQSLNVRGAELLVPGQTAGLSVYDVAERKGPVALEGRVLRSEQGARLLYDGGDLGMRAACFVTPGPRHTMALNIVVEDLRKTERGLTLELAIPLGTAGWNWWDGPDASRQIKPGEKYSSLTRLRGLPGLPEFDKAANLADFGSHSWLPVAAVTGKSGLGLAKPPRAASLFRLGFDGARGVLYCAWDFALSQDTRTAGRAEFSLVLFPVEPAHGFRGALAELYELFPDDFRSRVPGYGGWMPFRRLSEIADVDEFGFAYQEGAPEPGVDDALGVASFVYFHCAGEFVDIPGYTRDKPLPPYEGQLAAVEDAIKRRTGVDRLWETTGIRLPDGKIEIRPESTYGHLFAQPCVDPDLPYGKLMADSLTTRVLKDPFPSGVDGCYYDGLAVGLDYAREHFKVAKHPLLWDAERKRAVAYNFFASLEWAEHIADTVHPRKKLTMLNDSSVSSFPFVFPHIDVLGAEGDWSNSDDSFLRIRAYAYHKPFCTLLKTDYRKHSSAEIETYMRSCLVFGHLFGFFDISPSGANPGSSYWEHPEWYDRDRPLFRRYMPLCAEICRAGWEPVPLASAAPDGVKVERFGGGRLGGQGDLVYYTIRRRPDSQGGPEVTLRLSPEVRSAQANDAIAVDLLTGAVQPAASSISLQVPAGEIGVVAIGARSAQLRRATDRIARLIEGRKRCEIAAEKPMSGLGPWSAYMKGAEIDHKVAHHGEASLRVRLDDARQSAGVTRSISLDQKTPEELIVKGFSRAENVSGKKDSGYSIYVDCYTSEGPPIYGQTIAFETGTHDWQGGELRIRPTVPVKSVSFYCMFRSHTGTAWFDDLFLAKASAPGENLLDGASFEPKVPRAITAAAEESSRRLEEIRQRVAKPESAAKLSNLLEAAQADLAWIRSQPPSAASVRAARDFQDVVDLLRLAGAAAEGKRSPGFLPGRLCVQP
ncbi:MAG: hypothetical protein HUU20_14600 [Pirellulales bacterium]|nr:hypothetical protein [Pirellulales bacterium]